MFSARCFCEAEDEKQRMEKQDEGKETIYCK